MATNFKPAFMEHTMLFPCAAGVQMPQIGVDDPKIKPLKGKSLNSKLLPVKFVPQDVNPVDEHYVKMVSSGLSFSQDVVEDRCMHMMPYSSKYFDDVFEPPGGLVTIPTRSRSQMGRHNKIGTDVRHMPCCLKKTVKSKPLTPLRKQAKEKALMMHKQAMLEAKGGVGGNDKMMRHNDGQSETGSLSQYSFFLTEPQDVAVKSSVALDTIPEVRSKRQMGSDNGKALSVTKTDPRESTENRLEGKSGDDFTSKSSEQTSPTRIGKKDIVTKPVTKGDWDDHLMSRLSKLTANWIVHERMTVQDKTKDKLTKTLASWYGPPTHTDLVREEMSDGDDKDEKVKEKKPKSKWKKKEAS